MISNYSTFMASAIAKKHIDIKSIDKISDCFLTIVEQCELLTNKYAIDKLKHNISTVTIVSNANKDTNVTLGSWMVEFAIRNNNIKLLRIFAKKFNINILDKDYKKAMLDVAVKYSSYSFFKEICEDLGLIDNNSLVIENKDSLYELLETVFLFGNEVFITDFLYEMFYRIYFISDLIGNQSKEQHDSAGIEYGFKLKDILSEWLLKSLQSTNSKLLNSLVGYIRLVTSLGSYKTTELEQNTITSLFIKTAIQHDNFKVLNKLLDTLNEQSPDPKSRESHNFIHWLLEQAVSAKSTNVTTGLLKAYKDKVVDPYNKDKPSLLNYVLFLIGNNPDFVVEILTKIRISTTDFYKIILNKAVISNDNEQQIADSNQAEISNDLVSNHHDNIDRILILYTQGIINYKNKHNFEKAKNFLLDLLSIAIDNKDITVIKYIVDWYNIQDDLIDDLGVTSQELVAIAMSKNRLDASFTKSIMEACYGKSDVSSKEFDINFMRKLIDNDDTNLFKLTLESFILLEVSLGGHGSQLIQNKDLDYISEASASRQDANLTIENIQDLFLYAESTNKQYFVDLILSKLSLSVNINKGSNSSVFHELLLWAIRNNNLKFINILVDKYLDKYSDPLQRNGFTLLHWVLEQAVIAGNIELIISLERQYNNTINDPYTREGYTLKHYLIEQAADLVESEHGQVVAADIIKQLDYSGPYFIPIYPLLSEAVANNNNTIKQLVINHLKDVFANKNIFSNNKDILINLLKFAVNKNNFELIKYLLGEFNTELNLLKEDQEGYLDLVYNIIEQALINNNHALAEQIINEYQDLLLNTKSLSVTNLEYKNIKIPGVTDQDTTLLYDLLKKSAYEENYRLLQRVINARGCDIRDIYGLLEYAGQNSRIELSDYLLTMFGHEIYNQVDQARYYQIIYRLLNLAIINNDFTQVVQLFNLSGLKRDSTDPAGRTDHTLMHWLLNFCRN